MKVCLITYADYYFRSVLSSFEKSKIDFCRSNNIDFIFESIKVSNEKTSWSKIDLILKHICMYDAVIICDYDSVVIDTNYNIRPLLEKYKGLSDCVCAELANGFTLIGCSIWYNTLNSINVLKRIRQLKIDGDMSFLAEEAVFNEVIKTLPLRIAINNNVNTIYNLHNYDDPFLLHYAGVGNPFKIKQLEQERQYNCR